MTPAEYCQQRAAQSGSSFYYSFLFLPPPRRAAITALYAFCREVDDVVDEIHDHAIARTKLAWWRTEVGRIYIGEPQHPVAKALSEVVRAFPLREENLLEIIAGMEMDLDLQRYDTFAQLELYLHRAAGVVGLLSAAIFGYSNPRTLEYAELLGQAFQLTNIIRDVGEDARRGRIYIPREELERYGVPEKDILGGIETPAFKKMMQFQVDRASSYYDGAISLLPPEDRAAQRTGLIMAAIYRTLLHEIAADGCRVLTTRTALTPVRKLWIACRTWWGF